MQDIENIDVDDIEIKNPYSKNPFWNQKDKVENYTYEYLEFQKYKDAKEVLQTIINVDNYKLTKISFIIVFMLIAFLWMLSIAAIFTMIILKQYDYSFFISFDIINAFCGFCIIVIILGIHLLDIQYPLRKTAFFKKFQKSIKKNKKIIRDWSYKIAEFEHQNEHI